MKIQPNYVEICVRDLEGSRRFYEEAFGFSSTAYGPAYAAVEGGPVEIGLRAIDEVAPPMPTFETDDLEAALAAAERAGATIVAPIFTYPGGRRFELTDPSGNRLAVYQKG